MPTEIPVIDEVQKQNLTKSLLGETIAVLEKAFLDAFDEKDVLDYLRPYLKNAGTAFAINMRSWYGIQGDDLEAIAKITLLFDHLFEINTIEIEKSNDRIVRVIDDSCPYRGFPPVECKIRVITLNAVCNTINPDYCCRMDQMFCNGDSSCISVIEKMKASEVLPTSTPGQKGV